MKKLISIILCVLATLPAMAQLSTGDVEIQVLVPPEKTINYADKDVAVVAIHYYKDAAKGRESGFVFDSTLVSAVANGIKSTFEESPLFDGEEIPVFNMYSDTSMLAQPIAREELLDLSEQSGAKIILSVEYAYFVPESKRYTKDVQFSCLMRVYDADVDSTLASYLLKDNVSLMDESFQEIETNEALQMTAEMVGDDFAKRIVPTWETVDRFYYYNTLNNDSYKAHQFVEKGEWEKAAECWTNMLTSNKKSNQALAMYNLALACEMSENFDLALKWLSKCKSLDVSSVDPSPYMKVIQSRIADKAKLDKIMN